MTKKKKSNRENLEPRKSSAAQFIDGNKHRVKHYGIF